MTPKLVILGSGPAGLTAALYAARADLAPVVVAGMLSGGQLTRTTEVENFPGFPEGIAGPELMDKMREQAQRFGSEHVFEEVERVDMSTRPFRVWSAGKEFAAKSLIVATGASARWMGMKSE